MAVLFLYFRAGVAVAILIEGGLLFDAILCVDEVIDGVE
jgi:hypothetical protein